MSSITFHLTTAGGVPYKLMEGYPKGSFEEEDAEVQEQYLIPMQYLYQFIQESFSDMDVVPGTTWRYTPARSFRGNTYLVTKKIDFEPYPQGLPGDPFGSDSSLMAASPLVYAKTYALYSLVTITYSAGPSKEKFDGLLDISGSATGEFILYPGKSNVAFTSSQNPTAADMAAAANRNPTLPCTKVVPGFEWSAKFRRVPNGKLPDVLDLCRSTIGCVNDLAMPVFQNADPETVLFVGFSYETKWTWREDMPSGTFDMKFLEKRIDETDEIKGHNHFFNPKTYRWERLKRPNGSGGYTDVYERVDLNEIFYGSEINPGT